MVHVYKIKKSLQIPMALALVLSVPVFYDLFTRGLPTGQLVLIGILMVLFYLMAISNLIRRVILDGPKLTIVNYLGRKEIDLPSVSALDGLSLGKRQFLSVSSGGRHHLIQNSFEGFFELMEAVSTQVPATKIRDGLEQIRRFPQVRTGDTIAAWVTVAILAAVIFFRFVPH